MILGWPAQQIDLDLFCLGAFYRHIFSTVKSETEKGKESPLYKFLYVLNSSSFRLTSSRVEFDVHILIKTNNIFKSEIPSTLIIRFNYTFINFLTKECTPLRINLELCSR